MKHHLFVWGTNPQPFRGIDQIREEHLERGIHRRFVRAQHVEAFHQPFAIARQAGGDAAARIIRMDDHAADVGLVAVQAAAVGPAAPVRDITANPAPPDKQNPGN